MVIKESQEKFDFNKEKLFNYVKKFSFPRLAGTEGEKEAVDFTFKTFKEIGFEDNKINFQHFEFSTFYSKEMIKIMIFLNLIFVSIILLVKFLYTFFTLITILIVVLVFFSMSKALKHPELKGFWEKNFGKFISATNVFVKIPAINGSSKKVGNLIVSAHLDSKSQTFKTFWRVFLARLWLFSEIILFFFYILYLIDYHFLFEYLRQFVILFEIFILIGTILTVISNFLLLLLRIGNKSNGSLDNATGMSIVFELSAFFNKHPLNNFNIWFCQFSAEEIGTMGSREFLDVHEDEFSKEYTYQINFDMVSDKNSKNNLIEYIKSYGVIPRKKISPILGEYFKKAANIEKINYKEFNASVGAHTDSIPFHLRKFDSIDITTRSAAYYTHSVEDTLDKVDPQILLEACRVTRLLINLLDTNFKNLTA